MSNPVVLPVGGLQTDPSPHYDAQAGALRVADDVLCDRDGLARPRCGMAFVASKSSSQRPRSMTSYGSGVIVNSWDGSSTWALENTSSSITGTDVEPINYRHSFMQFAEARRNLYYCSKGGVHKITDATDTSGANAGMHDAPNPNLATSASGTLAALPNNMATAYRICFVKRDANDVVVRSPPSPWQRIGNASGGTLNISVVITLPTYAAAGDQIEVYRTNAVTGSSGVPSDQMYLSSRYAITSGDVTAGTVTILDTVADANLAQELYSNSTREGSEKINSRPPASRALAWWSDCMWFGGTIGPWTSSVDIKADAGTPASDGAPGWGRFEYGGASATSGSPTITGLGSTNSVVVGQLATDNAAPGTTAGTIPVGAFVISKTGTTVTLDQNATATAVFNLSLHDRIKIGSENYYAGTSTSTSGGSYPTFLVGNADAVNLAVQISRAISINSSTYYALAYADPTTAGSLYGGTDPSAGTLIIRQIALYGSAPTVNVYTTSSSYSSQLTAAGAIVVARDDRPNRLHYSKPFEPEHVPEGVNWIEMGSESEPILALVPLRAALLVFKSDGAYRISGSAPDFWRVDLLDPDLRVLRGECATSFLGEAAVWARSGVFLVNEGGPRSVSANKIDATLAVAARAVIADSTTTGAFVVGWSHGRVLLVGTPSDQAQVSTTYSYAFSSATGQWSRWTFAAYCGAHRRSNETFLLARAGAYWEIRGAAVADVVIGMDRSYTISAWTYTAGSTTVTVSDAQRGDWVPKAGDWVVAGIGGLPYYRRVTAAVDTGTSYDLTIDSAFPAGAQSDLAAAEGIISKLQWQAATQGKPSRTKHCNGIHVLMDWMGYSGTVGGSTARLLVGGFTDVTTTLASETVTETRAAKSVDLFMRPTRSLARHAHFFPYIETCDIGLDWKCAGVTLDIDPVDSEKTTR